MYPKRSSRIGLFVMAICLGLLLRPTVAQTPNRATLEPLLGLVEILPADAAEEDIWLPVTEVIEVGTGDQIRTDSAGWAVLTFFEGTVTEILSDTQLNIEELELGTSAESGFTIRLDQIVGDTFSTAATILDEQSRFEIRAPSVTLAVRGTTLYTLVTPEGRVRYGALEGLLSTQHDQADEILVGGGESVTYESDNPLGETLNAVYVPDTPTDDPDAIENRPDRVGEGTLIIPFIEVDDGGIELFVSPSRQAERRSAVQDTLFRPYLAGFNADGTWAYMYYFGAMGYIDGWSPVGQIIVTEEQKDLLPSVPDEGLGVRPRLPQTPEATIPQARQTPTSEPEPSPDNNY